jgi:NAD(P)-dependent dehydrogenase (short-subunit alcohol dehydrogenase family)
MNNQSQSYSNFLSLKMNKNNKKKVAIITGAAGRIGSVFLNELIFRNYICICLSRNKKNLDELKKNIPKEKLNNIIWFKFDLMRPKNISTLIKILKKNFKRIDCLINCAMSSNRGKNFSYDYQSYLNEMNGVFGTTFLLTEKILPLIRKSKDGRIINVGSVWGTHAPRYDVYLEMDIGPTPIIASGKAAILQYTKFLASRESKFNLKSNCLIPGWFPRKGKKERKDYIRKITQNIPQKRIGKLEDLVSAVNFLLSEKNTYFNGQSLYVDGGYTTL